MEGPARCLLDDLRSRGWVVAVHNDYRLDGVLHTFWLFTKGNRCAKGEGRTDEEALLAVKAAIDAIPRNDAEVERDMAHQALAAVVAWVTENGRLGNHGHRKLGTSCAECTVLNDAIECLEHSAEEARKAATPYTIAQARIKALEEVLAVKEAHEKELERLRGLLAETEKKGES